MRMLEAVGVGSTWEQVVRIPISIVIFIMLFMIGCGGDEATPVEKDYVEPMKTGVSGSEYLNVEYGFRLSNLPTSGWTVKTTGGKDPETDSEDVLMMTLTTEDRFSFDRAKLQEEDIPYILVYVSGPYPEFQGNPSAAKEFTNEVLQYMELLFMLSEVQMEVVSKQPVAGVNCTGYEVELSFSSALFENQSTGRQKMALFTKNEMGYNILMWAPEDKYEGLLPHVDPIIASFQLFGR